MRLAHVIVVAVMLSSQSGCMTYGAVMTTQVAVMREPDRKVYDGPFPGIALTGSCLFSSSSRARIEGFIGLLFLPLTLATDTLILPISLFLSSNWEAGMPCYVGSYENTPTAKSNGE